MNKRKRLKWYVLPSIYLMTMVVLFVGVYYTTKGLFSGSNNYSYTVSSLDGNDVPVISTMENEGSIIMPFKDGTANILVYYYSINESDERKTNSLISYESTYFKNTGILYGNQNEFDVLSSLDGKVVSVKEDNILGNIVEIECAKSIKLIYSSLRKVNVKEGDNILQGDIIGISGTNKLNESIENNLLFEVYYNGNLIDPLTFYSMNIDEL